LVSIILRALGRPAGHSILPFPALPIVVAGETLDAERFLSGDRRGSSPIAWRAFCQFAIVRPGPWAAVPTASGLRTPYDYADRSPDAASNRRGFAAGCQHNQQVSIAPIPSEARLPRRPAGGHLQGAQAQSDTRAKLRSDGRAGMAGENGGSHPGPRAASHPLLRLLCQSRTRRSRRHRTGKAHARRFIVRLIFQADPLVCKRCGGPLEGVAYITDGVHLRARIL